MGASALLARISKLLVLSYVLDWVFIMCAECSEDPVTLGVSI